MERKLLYLLVISSVVLLLVLEISGSSAEPQILHPIVLVPGDGGSQVEAKLNKTQRVHFICSYTSDWFDLWLNLEQMVPEVFSCHF